MDPQNINFMRIDTGFLAHQSSEIFWVGSNTDKRSIENDVEIHWIIQVFCHKEKQKHSLFCTKKKKNYFFSPTKKTKQNSKRTPYDDHAQDGPKREEEGRCTDRLLRSVCNDHLILSLWEQGSSSKH